MQYALLGRTGVRVSRITLGTASLGVAPTERDAPALFKRALDAGINSFDCANGYGNQSRFDLPGVDAPPADVRPSAEEIMGKVLKGHRHDVIIATKLGERVDDGPNGGGRVEGGGLSRLHVMRQVERSLRRLGTDYIDIYYAHHPDPVTPVEESLRVMDDLVRQGKIRYFAVSNHAGWQVAEAVLTARRWGLASAPVANTVSYSLAVRRAEAEVIPACQRFEVSLMPFSPLGGGLLAGAANTRRAVAGTQRWRAGEGPGYTPEQLAIAGRMDRLGGEWGHAPTTLAIGWLLAKPIVASAVVGATRVESLDEAIAAADAALTEAHLRELDAVGR